MLGVSVFILFTMLWKSFAEGRLVNGYDES